MDRVSYIAISGTLLFIAFLIPFLMVIRVLEPSLIILIITYIISIIGLVLGIYGVIEKYLKRIREEGQDLG